MDNLFKKEGNFYRQIDEDNPLVYELDNSVSELRDLKRVKWIYDIYSSSLDNGSEKVYQYVINKLSKFKKQKITISLSLRIVWHQ